MANTILAHHDGVWAPLRSTPYAREDILQEMIATWPELLAADAPQTVAARLLLVSREIAIPDAADAGGRWALDHLFIDQAGVPTLVETKRSSDTRARREVVAQMLDYAANAVVYWPIEFVQMQLQARCAASGQDAEVVVAEFLGDQMTPELFWERVKTNLQAGRVRLLFVADQIGPELERIIEFLNQQMDPAEVLGLELRQYQGEGLQTLVPRWVGQTAFATARKAASPSRAESWTREDLLEAVRSQQGAAAADVVTAILDWAQQRGLILRGEKGSSPSISLLLPSTSSYLFNISGYPSSTRLYLSFANARRRGVAESELAAITDRLAGLAGSRAAPVSNRDYPGILIDARLAGGSSTGLIDLLEAFHKLVNGSTGT
jgi:hypothetical protein